MQSLDSPWSLAHASTSKLPNVSFKKKSTVPEVSMPMVWYTTVASAGLRIEQFSLVGKTAPPLVIKTSAPTPTTEENNSVPDMPSMHLMAASWPGGGPPLRSAQVERGPCVLRPSQLSPVYWNRMTVNGWPVEHWPGGGDSC